MSTEQDDASVMAERRPNRAGWWLVLLCVAWAVCAAAAHTFETRQHGPGLTLQLLAVGLFLPIHYCCVYIIHDLRSAAAGALAMFLLAGVPMALSGVAWELAAAGWAIVVMAGLLYLLVNGLDDLPEGALCAAVGTAFLAVSLPVWERLRALPG